MAARGRAQAERQWTHKFTWIGTALGLAGLAYAVFPTEPNAYLGSALFFAAFGCLLAAFWDQFAWNKSTKIIACVIAVIVFSTGDVFWVRYLTRPTFVFVNPGVWLNGNSWDFVMNHRGPKTSFDVDVLFQDSDKVEALKQQSEQLSPSDIAGSEHQLHFDEINPKGRGSLFALQFIWQPFSPNLGHYSIEITTRDGHEHQELEIARVDGKWLYETRVKDAESGDVLLDCKDLGFPAEERQGRKPCFPSISQYGN
jgi:hypothetical protein